MTQQISTRIEHVPTELGEQGYARLVFLADGQSFAHHNFAVQFPTNKEIQDAIISEAHWLLSNPHFKKFEHGLFYLAYPWGYR